MRACPCIARDLLCCVSVFFVDLTEHLFRKLSAATSAVLWFCVFTLGAVCDLDSLFVGSGYLLLSAVLCFCAKNHPPPPKPKVIFLLCQLGESLLFVLWLCVVFHFDVQKLWGSKTEPLCCGFLCFLDKNNCLLLRLPLCCVSVVFGRDPLFENFSVLCVLPPPHPTHW
jgi:hypothetical protein